MAAINTVLVVTDVATNGTATTTTLTGVEKLHWSYKFAAPEDISYTANGDELDKLTPGLPPGGTRIIALSLDGGDNADTRMLSGGTMVDNTAGTPVSETGKGLGEVLTKKVTERLSAQQITVWDAFNGIRGKVKPTSGGVITPGGILPTFQGLAGVVKSLYSAALAPFVAFSWVIPDFKLPSGTMFRRLSLDIDVNRDTPLRATQAVADRIGSYADPQRAQYVIDSGDFGVMYVQGAAPKQSLTVTLGNLGTFPIIDFTDLEDENTLQPILDGSQYQPQTLQMLRSVRIKGGSTQHGVPDNGKLTDIVTTNSQRLQDATGDVQSGMPIISIYGDRNHGGVYYMPGDNALHAWSQAMGVNGLWYDESLGYVVGMGGGMLYAATDAGVYQHVPDINDTSPWVRLGGMALKILKVLMVNQKLYCLAEVPKSSVRHVLQWGLGAAGQVDYGFSGWNSVYAADGLFDFAVSFAWYAGQPITVVYGLATGNNVGYVLAHAIEDGGGLFGADKRILIPGGDGITTGPGGIGLDPIVPFGTGSRADVASPISFFGNVVDPTATYGVYVRTDAGSDGLFWIAGVADTMVNVSPGHTPDVNLVDALRVPIQVNHVYQHGARYVQWGFQSPAGSDSQGVPNGSVKTWKQDVNLMAATSRGVYMAPQLASYPWTWRRTDGQSNLGDINIKRVASGTPRLWLYDQIRCPVYGIDDTKLYVSYNGGINWVDIFAQNLDAGPAFFHLHRKWAADHRYPNNDTQTINYPTSSSTQFKVVRSLDGIGHPTYEVVNTLSQAPAEACLAQELSNIATATQVPEIQASTLLLDAAVRVLGYTALPQTILQIKSRFSDTADALRFLRPTHQCSVSGTVQNYITGLNGNAPMTTVTYSGLVCYVLEHAIDYDAATDPYNCYTNTRLGVLCLDDRADPSKVDADLLNSLSRVQLYQLGS